MKVCPFCAEEIQDAAILCKHCGRDVGPQPGGKVESAKASSSKVGIALLLLLAVFVSVYVVNAVSDADAQSRAERGSDFRQVNHPAIVDIAPTTEIEVPADGFQHFQWEAPSGKTTCQVTGRIEVIAGGNKDVEVYLVPADEWTNMRNGNAFRTYVSSPRTSVITLDETIHVTGPMALVVSNKFSVLTPKRVQFTGVRASCT